MGSGRGRAPTTAEPRDQRVLRDLNAQLSLLNHHVSGCLDLNDVDLDCLISSIATGR